MKLLDDMERIAKEKVIVYTPNGFLPQGTVRDNPYQVHLSGWTTEEFESRGYNVIGINGWKPLRHEFSRIRFRPIIFWKLVSGLTRRLVRIYPKLAFQLLATKEMRVK